MNLRVDDTADWPVYKKAFYKLYRPAIENPRRKALQQKIINLPPIPASDSKEFSIHCLICQRDIDMLICSARTVALSAGYAMPYVFHDDGSFNDENEAYLLDKLPGVRVVRRAEADARASEELANYPNILQYRKAQVMALKLVDARVWGRGKKFGYIDSDIVFLRRPEQYLSSLEELTVPNRFNKDIDDAYVQPANKIEQATGIRPCPRVNAGLWVMRRSDIDLDTIESWLALPIFKERPHFYTLDQTFISMLAAKSEVGAEHFEKTYDVDFLKPVETSVTKHYVGRIRHGFETEGLKYLLEECDFESRWRELVRSAGS